MDSNNAAYYNLRKDLLKSARQKDIPIAGIFELTGRCNFSCKMCYVHETNEAKVTSFELSTDQWIKLFDEAYEAGMMFALLTGGECLMRKDFRVLYLHLWNRGIFLSVNTNAALIDDSYVSFFAKYPPKRIQISLYGCNNDTYQSLTGHRAFSKVNNNISKLIEMGLDVSIAITPNKFFYDACIDTIQYAIDNHYNYSVSETLLKPRTDNCNDYFLTAEEFASILVKAAELSGKTLSPVAEESLPKPGGIAETQETALCNGGRSRFYISWKGEMSPCIALDSIKADALNNGFMNAWRMINKEVKQILQPEECINCKYKKICTICPGMRHDDIWDKHCNPETCKFIVEKCKRGLCHLDSF